MTFGASKMRKPIVVIGGTTSGVGKTSIAVGLMAALRDRGLTVQAFKVGPDFIDPMHHAAATGRPSINLDGWMLTKDQVLAAFDRHMADADVAVVEGVMGLFDGRDGTTEAGSTAQIAKWLNAPVLLVLDCSAVARSAAAIVKGYQDFDPALRLGALVFNKVGGAAHTKWLSDAIASSGLDLPVLGGIPKEESVVMQERYLGLHMPDDPTMPLNLIHNLAELMKNHVDLDMVLSLARSAAKAMPGAAPKGHLELDDGLAPESPPPSAESPGRMPVSLRSDTAHESFEEGCQSPAESTPENKSNPMSNSFSISARKRKLEAERQKAEGVSSGNAVDHSENGAHNGIPQHLESDNESGSEAVEEDEEEGILAIKEETSDEVSSLATALTLPLGTLSSHPIPFNTPREGPLVRIAVAQDSAFCFYYYDNLTLLEDAGAELVPFSPLADPLPSNIAGVYLGGGYPERHAAELADNKLLRAELKAFADAGGVIYAECGGLLYLSQSIQPQGEPPQPMVGVFPFKTVLPPGRYVMGYVEIETTPACPLFPPGTIARGHVHHASELVEEHHVGGALPPPAVKQQGSGGGGDNSSTKTAGMVGAAWRTSYISRPQVPGAPEAPEGFTRSNVLASYVHLHWGGCPELAEALVEKCREVDVESVSTAVLGAEATAHLLDGSCTQSAPATSSLRLSLSHASMPGSRSSQDLLPPPTERTVRSVDYGRHSVHPAPLPPKIPSPAITLNKVVSSGSLSTHSGYLPHLAPVHIADRASQHSGHSESPSAMSPRTNPGSESGGYCAVPQQQYSNSQLYHPTVPDADQYGQGAGSGMMQPFPPLPLPPGSGRNSMNLPMPQYQTQYHYPQQQQQYMRYSNAGPGSGNLSDDGYGMNHVPRTTSWAQLHPSTSYGSLDLMHPQHPYAQQQQQQHYMARQQMGPGGGLEPLDLSGVGRYSIDWSGGNRGGALPPLPSGHMNALNWQYKHNYPPSDKIATLGPGATEVVWGLGLGNRVVAVSDCCDFPAEAAGRAKAARCLPSGNAGTAGSSSQGSAVHSPMKAGSNGNNSSPGSCANLQALAVGTAVARDRLTSLAGLSNGPFRVDDQVLARERPGLIIYEEEEPTPVPVLEGKEDKFGIALGTSNTGMRRAHSSATDFSPPEPLSPEHPEQVQQPGALGRAVYDAVMAVGLQSSCRVLCLRRSTLADVLSSMLAVGEAAGIGDEAVRAVDRLRARLRRVGVESARAAASSLNVYTMRPRVLVLRSLQPLVVEGRWAADMVMLAGGEFGLTQPGDPPRTLTWQEVVDFAPEVLVIGGMRDGSGPRTFHDLCTVAALPGWWLIPAVKSGAVYVCEEALIRRGGPRLVEGCEALARMVHGDGVSVCCPPRAVMKLSLRPGQRCRPRLLPNYFMAYC